MASKSRPTTEAPPSGPGRLEQGQERPHQRLERVGRDLQGDRDVVPAGRRGCRRPPRHAAGAKPMAWSRPSSRPQRAASSLAGRGQLLGLGGRRSRARRPARGSLRAVRRVSESPRPAPESTTSAPSSWARRATREGQRGVGQDAGHQDALAVEQSHGRARLRQRRQPGAGPGRRRRRVPWPADRLCHSWAMHVGILGGTGPAGRGLAVRLSAAGVRRSPSGRARPHAGEEVAAGLRDAWAERLAGPVDRGRQRRGGRLRAGGGGHPVGRRGAHGPARWPRTSPARWSSRWPTPW